MGAIISMTKNSPKLKEDGMLKYFKYKEPFHLESGQFLPEIKIAYQTFGKLNDEKDNVIWVIHALTANSNPIEWWPGVVGDNCAIDPSQHFIVCANCLGSHYGSTSPLSKPNENREPYYHDFPLLTNRDVANAYDLVRKELGIDKIKLLTGASLGGQQALEWSILFPDVIENLFLLATNAKHSPYGIAFNESQRLCISADQTWSENSDDAGSNGLLAARSVALLSYRSAQGYNISQTDDEEKLDHFKVQKYQQYQGEKLVNRFNAFSYWTLSKMMDSHNLGRSRGGLIPALQSIQAKTYILGIDSDLLFPIEEQKFLNDHIKDSKLFVIESNLGHDGFLTEPDKIGEIISEILSE